VWGPKFPRRLPNAYAVSGGSMYEQEKAQKARFIGWGIGLALVVAVVVAKLVFKF
jgi:hypothetical protein